MGAVSTFEKLDMLERLALAAATEDPCLDIIEAQQSSCDF
jgi:hypothetical protein